jgi:hypothetical protein
MDRGLTRFAWLSIGAALATIFRKTSAYCLTGSMGLLSHALESIVNLIAAAEGSSRHERCVIERGSALFNLVLL